MCFIAGMDRPQTLLLSETLEDYASVSAQHPVRFLDAFVEGLDLKACGFARTEAAQTERPPYAIYTVLLREGGARSAPHSCNSTMQIVLCAGRTF